MRVETKKSDGLGFISELGLSVRATNVLIQMGLNAASQLAELDQQTLMRKRNCGKKTTAEILEAAARFKPSIESSANKMDATSLSAAIEHTPVTDLRLSVRAMGALERLRISTIGQLARLSDQELLSAQNFGKKSLREVQVKLALLRSRGVVVWRTQQQTAVGLSRQITRLARKLRRLRNASSLLQDEPRFGHLIRETGVDAKNAREAADIIFRRIGDPIDRKPLTRRLTDLIRAVQAANRMSLEVELWSLTVGLGGDRDREIIVAYLGWDGKPPRTLEAVGLAHGMTRERVRQICARLEKVRSSKPFVPVLDRALKMVAASAPMLAEEIEGQLVHRRLTKCGFCVEALLAAARDLGRDPPFALEMLHGCRIVVPNNGGGLLVRIDQVARAAISHWGVASVEDVAAAAGAGISLTQRLLPILPSFRWLDEPSGWFWIANMPRNSLLSQIRKILAASPCIDVGELRTGVARHHRKKGFAPPRRVLLELCRHLPWCRVEGEKITVAAPLKVDEVLSASEQIILKVLNEHGPVIQRTEFERLCLDAGMNHHSFWVFLSYCPLICRHARGVYGLRGAEVPIGLVERLVPKRADKSKLLVDYSWTDDRKIQFLYRISEGMLTSGVVSIPAAMKNFVQGRFTLISGDNSKIGTLVVKENSGWGLGPFFTRRGGESGDYLWIIFDPPRRIVTVQIGDAGLTDHFLDPVPVVEDPNSSIRSAEICNRASASPNAGLPAS